MVCIVCVDILGNRFIGVRVCLTTFVVSVVSSIVCVVLGWVLLSFELTVLIPVMIWFSAVVIC